MQIQKLTLALLLAAIPANAAIINVLPSALTIGTGSSVTVNIQISNVIDLYAWQVDFSYDPLIAIVTLVNNGSFLATGGTESFFAGSIDNNAGAVSSIGSTLTTAPTGVNGSGILATITITAVAAGQSNLSLFNIILLDSTFADITPVTANSALLTVTSNTSIPEPNFYWGFVLLMAAFLAGRGCCQSVDLRLLRRSTE